MTAQEPSTDWRDMVEHGFFSACPLHAGHSARESVVNMWSLSSHAPACALCVASRPLETYIQVRRSSYHDVVKMADISRFADISGIQGYTINSSKVIFLRRRPQPRPPKGAVGASLCTVCSRHLQDVSLFCSLQCKLDSQAGVKHVSLRQLTTTAGAGCSGGDAGACAAADCGDGCAAAGAALSSGSSARSSGGGPDTPLHPSSVRPLDAVVSSDSECMADFHGPPAKRRKGCPLRSPDQ